MPRSSDFRLLHTALLLISPEPGYPPPPSHQPQHRVRRAFAPHPSQQLVIPAAHRITPSDTLLLRVTQYSTFAVTTTNPASLDASHRKVKRVVNHERRID